MKFSPTKKHLVLIAAVIGVAAAGIAATLGSHAATPFINAEADAGTITSPAAKVTDSTASGGSAISFAAGIVTVPPPPGSCPAWPAFPTTTCTGVPAGYTLATSASLSSTAAGQTIDGKLVTGNLTIAHDNVTVTNSRVKGVVLAGSHKGLVLRNVDVGPDACPSAGNGNSFAVNADGYTLIRTHLHSIPNDVLRVGGGNPYVIQDSIIDGTCMYPADHLDAVQWYNPGGKGSVSVIHSIVDVRPVNMPSETGNAAIFWADGAGSGTTLTMYNNKFAGGGFSTALYDAGKGSGTVLDVHDNVYVKGSYAYGPCASSNSIVFDGTSGLKFANNKLDDGTAVGC